MPFTNIINSFLNVRNKVKNSDGDWVDQTKQERTMKNRSVYNATLGNENPYVIFEEWDKEIILESFEVGANFDTFHVMLHIEPGTGSYVNNIFHIVFGTSARGLASPGNIRNDTRGSVYLASNYHNESSGLARIYLKKPIHLPNGAKLSMIATNETSGNITYNATWTEIER